MIYVIKRVAKNDGVIIGLSVESVKTPDGRNDSRFICGKKFGDEKVFTPWPIYLNGFRKVGIRFIYPILILRLKKSAFFSWIGP